MKGNANGKGLHGSQPEWRFVLFFGPGSKSVQNALQSSVKAPFLSLCTNALWMITVSSLLQAGRYVCMQTKSLQLGKEKALILGCFFFTRSVRFWIASIPGHCWSTVETFGLAAKTCCGLHKTVFGDRMQMSRNVRCLFKYFAGFIY